MRDEKPATSGEGGKMNWTITTRWLAEQIRSGRKPKLDHFAIGNGICMHLVNHSTPAISADVKILEQAVDLPVLP